MTGPRPWALPVCLALGAIDLWWINARLAPHALAAASAVDVSTEPARPAPTEAPRLGAKAARGHTPPSQPAGEDTGAPAATPLPHVTALPASAPPRVVARATVFFASRAAVAGPQARAEVAAWSRRPLRAPPGSYVILEGFADGRGDSVFNQALSHARAESVAAQLRNAGVPADRLVVRARGVDPRGAHQPSGSWARHRRVEMRLVVPDLEAQR